MINYTEKGSGLHQAIRKAGYSLREENGVFVSDNDEAVQAIIDAYDPIPELQNAMWLKIQAVRDAKKNEGVTVGVDKFHSDEASRIQQLGLVMMGASIPANLQWKTMGGSFVTMTQTLAMQIFGATAASDTTIFANAETHKAAMKSITDWTQIEGYDYSGGW
jgi:hypothetical protein